jgi:hypothetical protein
MLWLARAAQPFLWAGANGGANRTCAGSIAWLIANIYGMHDERVPFSFVAVRARQVWPAGFSRHNPAFSKVIPLRLRTAP